MTSPLLQSTIAVIDWVGTFVFALSGGLLAVKKGFDLFGVLFLSFMVAVAGGIMRDVLIGAVPPVAVTQIHYFLIAMGGGLITFYWYPRVTSLQHQITLLSRVSTVDQNLDLQIYALRSAGCERLFSDRTSGARADCPGMREALDFARKDDVLIVWKLDRLSRSLGHLVETVQTLERRGIGFRSLTEMMDTSRPEVSGIFFPIFAALCSVERNLVRERTMAGLEAARQRGRVGGRPRVFTAEKKRAAARLLANGTPPRDVANVLGISIPTLYRNLPASQRIALTEAASSAGSNAADLAPQRIGDA